MSRAHIDDVSEGQDWALRSQVVREGFYLLEGDVTDIDIAVYDVTDGSATPDTAVYSIPSVSPSGVVVALTDDESWRFGDPGYNFTYTVTYANHGGKGGRSYLVVVSFNTTASGIIKDFFLINVCGDFATV